jgi:hypothetical protein
MTITLTRAFIRPVKADETVFKQPEWLCHCCHDSGIVNGNLIKLEADEYNPSIHGVYPCKATGCYTPAPEAVEKRKNPLSTEDCDRLAELSKEDWRQSEIHWNSEENRAKREAIKESLKAGVFKKLPKPSEEF